MTVSSELLDGMFDAARRRRGTLTGLGGVAAGLVVGYLAAVLLAAPAPDPAALEPGELVVLSGADESTGAQRRALIEQWNADPRLPDARLVEVSGGADAHRAEMVRRAQAGDRTVDIYNLDVTWTAEFADAGWIRPLDETVTDTSGFLEKPLATCRYHDRLWALPFNTDAGLLFYHADLTGDEPPTNLAGIRTVTNEVFARPGGPPAGLEAGYTGQLRDYEGLTVNALEAIWAAGGEVVDADGEVVVDSPATRAALTQLALGMTEGNPRTVLPASLGFDERAGTLAFQERRVLFMRNWPVAYGQLVAAEAGAAPLRIGTQPITDSVLGGQNLAIASGSDQPEAARRLIEFLTGERSQQLLFERGGFAATRELIYRDAAVRKAFPYADDLLTAVRAARLRPVTPRYAQFSEVFRRGVGYALRHGGQLPDGFADALRAALSGTPGGPRLP
ncbi:extracellular solute-binding protein [Catellatospora bangladeshensis]|uniref:ABC transporter substrate-binding protein n=1 Tax=Catellatospora bangladeshensis TaxID=310355 RepID=A0A8J3JME9_9ACTN|nr:extracellular solute-binding protein [Catellatospora bangladeshensis]GIF80614.1 ABC transporter substrate-binding protein [Catellatospora bangladeshensis]